MPRSYRRDAKSRISGIQNEVQRNNEGSRWSEDFSYEQAAGYGHAMRDIRGSHGMIDGFKTTKAGFDGYMDRRRAADARARGEVPNRGGSAWIGMSGRRVKQGECRVVRPANRGELTIQEVQQKIAELQSKWTGDSGQRQQYRQLQSRLRQLRAA